jgi:hypothetical protein
VIDALRRRGSASRSDLARLTGLSRTTVTTLVADLHTRGLIVEESKAPPRSETGSRGRRPSFLRLAPSAGAALGIDFGHRLIRVAVADLGSTVLAEQTIELDVDAAACAAMEAASKLTEVVLAEAQIERSQIIGAGVGIPGPIDHATGAETLEQPCRDLEKPAHGCNVLADHEHPWVSFHLLVERFVQRLRHRQLAQLAHASRPGVSQGAGA